MPLISFFFFPLSLSTDSTRALCLLNMSCFLVSLTKIFRAGMHIIIIVIPNLQKQMCIKTVAKIGLLLKIRQSKSFVISTAIF